MYRYKHDFCLYVYDLSDKHLIKKVPFGGEGYDILLSERRKESLCILLGLRESKNMGCRQDGMGERHYRRESSQRDVSG
jgi:hypothetical protein